jgi:hypothetical protein
LEELVSGLLRPKLFPFGKLSKAKPAAQYLFLEFREKYVYEMKTRISILRKNIKFNADLVF